MPTVRIVFPPDTVASLRPERIVKGESKVITQPDCHSTAYSKRFGSGSENVISKFPGGVKSTTSSEKLRGQPDQNIAGDWRSYK